MAKVYKKTEIEGLLHYIFEKFHQVENNIEKSIKMGTKGSLHPNLSILLGELEKLEKVWEAKSAIKKG